MAVELQPRLLQDIEPARGYPSLETLRGLGMLSLDEILTGETIIFETRGGESFVYAYRLDFVNPPTSLPGSRLIKAKYLISMANCTEKAENQYRRIRLLEESGIPVPRTYGEQNATIFQEFIPNDQTAAALSRITQVPVIHEIIPELDQLTAIALGLDRLGFRPRNFIGDLIFDGDRKQFLVMDTGEDLGPAQPNNSTSTSLSQLSRRFPIYESYIKQQYNLLDTLTPATPKIGLVAA